jgi:hypothetical protein
MFPHLGVHRGHQQHRATGSEQDGAEQVVGPAVGGAGQQVRSSRGDQDQIGGLPQPHVGYLRDVDEQATLHR